MPPGASRPVSATCLRNNCDSICGGTPRPSSRTDSATWPPSGAAATRMGAESGECRAALDSRLHSTCTTRSRSAITAGSSSGRSTATACRAPPETNAVRAASTRAATPTGSGATDSVPASMRPASRRLPISPCMWSAWPSTMRKNCSSSAAGSAGAAPSAAAAEPLMAASGARSSWLTMPRNCARCRSISSNGARSWSVTTTETVLPPGERIGVTLSRTRTARPSDTEISTSSARRARAPPSTAASGSPSSATSAPSAKRQVSASRASSGGRSGSSSGANMRIASRLTDAGRPVSASKTATPTGEVSTSASRSARARCSSR